jgi:hypothetical protein
MPSVQPPKRQMPPAQQKDFNRAANKFALLLLGGPVVIVIVAVNTGYFFGSLFVGTAAILLIVSIGFASGMSVRLGFFVAALILVGLGLPFIIPWDKSSGPGLTNDDRYRKLLGETAYSCQAGHYDEQNCRAQRQGLDDVAKWLNEQQRLR